MIKIITHYGLDRQGYTQHNVDFLDLYLGVDNRLFLDYNKILLNNSSLHRLMKSDIDAFMRSMFNNLVNRNDLNLGNLLKGLHETNATHLGMSMGNPKGNSVGDELKKEILNNLKFLRSAFLKGNLEIDTIYFGIAKIGPDRISDIVSSIVKLRLIEFTREQCIKHSIPTKTFPITNVFNSSTLIWESKFFELPYFEGKPVIFVPKDIVSSYINISGTFNAFIRYGFNSFFKNSSELKKIIRGNDVSLDKKLTRKEFDKYNKDNGINYKAISQKILVEFENKDVINLFDEIRKKVVILSDNEIIEIIENNFRQAN